MFETIEVTAVIVVLCAISYFIGTYVGFSIGLDWERKKKTERARVEKLHILSHIKDLRGEQGYV